MIISHNLSYLFVWLGWCPSFFLRRVFFFVYSCERIGASLVAGNSGSDFAH